LALKPALFLVGRISILGLNPYVLYKFYKHAVEWASANYVL